MRYKYRSSSRRPSLSSAQGVKYIIYICVGVFFLQWIARSFANSSKYLYYLALMPKAVTEDFFVWQLVTYIFLHGGIFHLFINMFILWMFGSFMERVWGTKEFLKYFFITGIGAGLFWILLAGTNKPTVGASGAIYGLLLAYGLTFPNRYVFIFFLFPLRAKYAVILFGGIELFGTLGGRGGGIAHLAHLGGMLVGFIYLKVFPYLKNSVSKKNDTTTDFKIYSNKEDEHDKRINRILDKIMEKGIESLTPEERKILKESSDKYINEEEDNYFFD